MTIVNGYDDNYQERTSNESLQRVKVNVCIYLNIKKFSYKYENNSMKFVIYVCFCKLLQNEPPTKHKNFYHKKGPKFSHPESKLIYICWVQKKRGKIEISTSSWWKLIKYFQLTRAITNFLYGDKKIWITWESEYGLNLGMERSEGEYLWRWVHLIILSDILIYWNLLKSTSVSLFRLHSCGTYSLLFHWTMSPWVVSHSLFVQSSF